MKILKNSEKITNRESRFCKDTPRVFRVIIPPLGKMSARVVIEYLSQNSFEYDPLG